MACDVNALAREAQQLGREHKALAILALDAAERGLRVTRGTLADCYMEWMRLLEGRVREIHDEVYRHSLRGNGPAAV